MSKDNIVPFNTNPEDPAIPKEVLMVLDIIDKLEIEDSTKGLTAALLPAIIALAGAELSFSASGGSSVITGLDFCIAIRTFEPQASKEESSDPELQPPSESEE